MGVDNRIDMAGVGMDYWREYFRSSNADIFEIIQRAIMLAASDCPKEFKIRRDNIAQILFSSTFINHSSACHHHHAHHHHAHDHHDEIMLNIKRSSSSSKVIINCSRNDSYDDDDAEALTDEIDQQSQTFAEVMRIKEILHNSPHESASVLCNSLRNLQLMSISVETLKATEIGKSVIVLRKHASKDVRQIARSLIEVWKDMVDEWVNATTKITVSENTPESINPSVLDEEEEEEEEEEGLPSPPLDDLAFLNPHSMSLELSEKFFDGMDDYGNPQKSEKCNNRKPPVEKQNVTMWKSQKPSNGPTMVPKPCKPPVVDSIPGRRMNPNMDQKLQHPEKTTPSKRPGTSQQRKAMSSGGVTDQDKLEATKRKLQERYQQAEKAKRQRTIQVMELQDLPKQEVTQKQQNVRPGNNHYRQRGNGRF